MMLGGFITMLGGLWLTFFVRDSPQIWSVWLPAVTLIGLGAAIGVALDNLGIGVAIGLVLGLAIGTALDRRAEGS